MADKINFSLVSPERQLFQGAVDQVIVPGEDGQFGALSHHALTMTVVKPGVVRVLDGNKETKIYVGGGIVDVTGESVIILAEDAVDLGSLDKQDVVHQIKNAHEDMRDAKNEDDRTIASAQIMRLESIAAAI